MPAVSVTTSSTEIVAEAYARTLVLIKNTATTGRCYIEFGSAATTTNWFLGPGETFIDSPMRIGKAAINGITSTGMVVMQFTEVKQGT